MTASLKAVAKRKAGRNSVTLFVDVLFRTRIRIRVKKLNVFFLYQHMFLDLTITFKTSRIEILDALRVTLPTVASFKGMW